MPLWPMNFGSRNGGYNTILTLNDSVSQKSFVLWWLLFIRSNCLLVWFFATVWKINATLLLSCALPNFYCFKNMIRRWYWITAFKYIFSYPEIIFVFAYSLCSWLESTEWCFENFTQVCWDATFVFIRNGMNFSPFQNLVPVVDFWETLFYFSFVMLWKFRNLS